MRSILSVAIVLALAACGGGSSSGSGSGSGTGTGTGSGSETPVASGEDEGFEDDGMGTSEPTIDHGSQSPHQLIGVNAPPTPWENMSAEEREWYMVGVFLPIEGESFAHYDASRFSQFECENCHGENAREHHFAMPSSALPPLRAPGTPQWEQMTHGPAYAFMHDTVVPECATMLGMQPAGDDQTGGFGCFNCHPHAQ
jgi:hypothetical protein